jgi:hypothetical protein
LLFKYRIYLFAFIAAMVWQGNLHARAIYRLDSIAVKADTIANDSAKLKNKNISTDLKSKIDYAARDSTPYSADSKTIFLYGDASVKYPAQQIELNAAFIQYDFNNGIAYATGLKDSTGEVKGTPVFKQGKETFKQHTLSYNFKTGKAFITDIITEQDGGFLHAQKTKRKSDGTIHLKNGMYTTCDAEHPHFGLFLTKGVAIPGDKIVSGPAYMVLEDVPLFPIGIPFGMFPNKRQNAASGVIIPSYGEESSRGFYLREGGYYFAISDYFDLTTTGDVYTHGTWGFNVGSNYRKRYKYNGSFSVHNYFNKTGIAGIDSGANRLQKSRDFSIVWSHGQEATANPTSRFSANVNYSSTTYNRNYNYTDPTQLMTSTQSSSISYSKTWTDYNLSSNLRQSQNNTTKYVNFDLPSVNFYANTMYPFRSKEYSGEQKWYENVTVGYSATLDNKIHGQEDEVFAKNALKYSDKAITHRVPVSVNFKFLRFFNLTPSLNYQGMFYAAEIRKHQGDSIDQSTLKTVYYEKVDTIRRFSYAQGFAPSASLSFNPTVYGTFMFPSKSKIIAIRHVITPSVSYSTVPDIKGLVSQGYFKTYRLHSNTDSSSTLVKYGIYDNNSSFGGTPQGSTRSGSFSFSLGNNLEMKVKSDKDTLTGTKKIVLIQSLNFSASYNVYAPNFKLSNIGISGSTPIPGLKGTSISYNGTINPYNYDTTGTGRYEDIYYWHKHNGIGYLTNAGLSFGYSWQAGGSKAGSTAKPGETKPGEKPSPDTEKDPKKLANKPVGEFAYFNVPLSISFAYSFNYSKANPKTTSSIIQTLSFNGNLPLTPKWTITYSSGYDFKAKDFSMTSFSIIRNLHCWQMSVNFMPFGAYKYYEFKINAISSFLHDLKYEQRKDFIDNIQY